MPPRQPPKSTSERWRLRPNPSLGALARDIEAAHVAGARLRPACEVAGIELRTQQRWKAHEGLSAGDGRPQAVRPTPAMRSARMGARRSWLWPTSRAWPTAAGRRRGSCPCWPTRACTWPASPLRAGASCARAKRSPWTGQGASGEQAANGGRLGRPWIAPQHFPRGQKRPPRCVACGALCPQPCGAWTSPAPTSTTSMSVLKPSSVQDPTSLAVRLKVLN